MNRNFSRLFGRGDASSMANLAWMLIPEVAHTFRQVPRPFGNQSEKFQLVKQYGDTRVARGKASEKQK